MVRKLIVCLFIIGFSVVVQWAVLKQVSAGITTRVSVASDGTQSDDHGTSWIPSTGSNFEAGSGLWICPDGKDDMAVMATEHYDSCGSPGKSRWGVTENWDD